MSACESVRTISVRSERYEVPCGSRYCPSCGQRWAKDQRVRAVAAAKHLTGACGLLTVTGPGRDYFAPAGEQTQAEVRAKKRDWNASARARWTVLHRRASKEARRYAREHGCDWRVSFRTWEWQRRRVLHLHLVVPFGTEVERTATTLYVGRLHALARAHDFGYVLGGYTQDAPSWRRPPRVKPADVNAVAAYVSKYVSKAGDSRNGMVNVARAAGMKGSVLYVASGLLQASGVSMESLRGRRRIVGRYPWARSSRRAWQEAALADALQRGRSPLTPDAVQRIRCACETGYPERLVDDETGEEVRLRPAAEPPGMPSEDEYTPVVGRRWAVGLASVLRRVPDRPELGPWATEITGVYAL